MKALIKLFGILSLLIVLYGCGNSQNYYASRPYGSNYYITPYNHHPEGYVRHDFNGHSYDKYYSGFNRHDETNEHHEHNE